MKMADQRGDAERIASKAVPEESGDVSGRRQTACISHVASQIPMDSLPGDVFLLVLSEAMDSLKAVPNLCRVSKKWNHAVSECNEAWKRLFLIRWPLANPSMQIKSWHRMYKRRYDVFGGHASKWSEYQWDQPIEGCDFAFRCPMKFSDLTGEETYQQGPGYSSQAVRTCQECDRKVFRVQSLQEAKTMAAEGHCVTFRHEEEDFMGEISCGLDIDLELNSCEELGEEDF